MRLVQETRRLMPDVGIQIPPNLADWWPELVQAGATDLGGLSSNGDHISPEHPFPSPKQVRERLKGIAAVSERLCVYPQYMNEEWIAPRVLDVIETKLPLASCRAARGAATQRRLDPARPRRRVADRRGADGDVRREPPRGDRGHAPGRGRAARGAGRRPRDVRRQPQHQRLEHLHGRLRVLRLRGRQALAGRLRALAGGLRAPDPRRAGLRRDRDLHAVGHPPRLGPGGLPGLAAAGQGDRAGDPPARVQPDGGRAHGRRHRALAARGLRAAARGRAWAASPAPPPRSCTTASASASARTSCPPARWVEIITAAHEVGLRIDRDGDVRPHRDAGRAGRAHARRARRCRTARAASPSSCR